MGIIECSLSFVCLFAVPVVPSSSTDHGGQTSTHDGRTKVEAAAGEACLAIHRYTYTHPSFWHPIDIPYADRAGRRVAGRVSEG